ncbi:MAG: DNA-processing protein DprA [Clostridiales bacterium]|jgi:DNA processing protein|nr:DNA-processing protein DprA [Clostridiales bacterium]
MELTNEDLLYEIWLSDICKNNPYEIYKILKTFTSAKEFYEHGRFNLKTMKHLGFDKFLNLDKSLEISKIIIENCQNENIDVISINDLNYPNRLKTISYPPRTLYIKGKMPDIDNMLCITIVGCRNPSPYGVNKAMQISYDLASCGILIISGMALGIDAAAHIGAIDANKSTVAVLPRGVDEAYPKQHDNLYSFIQNSGAIVSEYPPKTPVSPYVFEIRNRIMAGLSMGVVVIEAENRSGTRYTVKHAVENNRDVFALVGNATSKRSDYPNELIFEGVQPIRNAEDVLDTYFGVYSDMIQNNLDKITKKYNINTKELKIEKSNKNINDNTKTKLKKHSKFKVFLNNEKSKHPNFLDKELYTKLNEEEKNIIKYLHSFGKSHIDKIIRECKISASIANSNIMILQLKGIVKQEAGQTYALNENIYGRKND